MSESHWSQTGGGGTTSGALNDPSWYVYDWLASLPHLLDNWLLTDEQVQQLSINSEEIKRQLEATNPLAGQQSVYAVLLRWALQQVDCSAVASALCGDKGGVDL